MSRVLHEDAHPPKFSWRKACLKKIHLQAHRSPYRPCSTFCPPPPHHWPRASDPYGALPREKMEQEKKCCMRLYTKERGRSRASTGVDSHSVPLFRPATKKEKTAERALRCPLFDKWKFDGAKGAISGLVRRKQRVKMKSGEKDAIRPR